MFTAARDSVAPETRKGRTATVRPFTNFHSSNVGGSSTANICRQRSSASTSIKCPDAGQAAVMGSSGIVSVLRDDFA